MDNVSLCFSYCSDSTSERESQPVRSTGGKLLRSREDQIADDIKFWTKKLLVPHLEGLG